MSRLKVLITVLLVLSMAGVVGAQSFLMMDKPGQKTKLSLSFSHPFLNYEGLKFYSGVYDLSASVPVTKKLNLLANVPYTITQGLPGIFLVYSHKSSVMNLSLGLQYLLQNNSKHTTSITAGVYLPTTRHFSTLPEIITMSTQPLNIGKGSYKTTTAYAMLSHHYTTATGFMLDAQLGTHLSFAAHQDNPFLYFNYGVAAGYLFKNIAVKSEFAGSFYASDFEGKFGNRFENYWSAGVQWKKGAIQPGIFYAIPLRSDQVASLNGILGIKLDVFL